MFQLEDTMTSITIDLKEPAFIDIKKSKVEILEICLKYMQKKNCPYCKKVYNYLIIRSAYSTVESIIAKCNNCNYMLNASLSFNPFRIKANAPINRQYIENSDYEIYNKSENKTTELEDLYLRIE